MNNAVFAAKRWFPVAVVVTVIDQVTKRWALNSLSDGRVVDLPGPSQLRLSFNTGIAFGQGQGRGLGPVIAAIGLIVIIALVTRIAQRSTTAGQYAIGLIVGGAVGNLIDRFTQAPGLLRGGVIDFIQAFDWFPVFNVADACITVGGILLVWTLSSGRDGAEVSEAAANSG